MSFCPVPHSRREQAWLLIGAGLGAGVAFLSHRRRKSQATEASSPAAEDGRASGAAAAAAAPQEAPSASDPPLDHVVLTSDPLPLGSLASKVVCPSAGGIASFIGTTRDHFEGKEVVRLEVTDRPATAGPAGGVAAPNVAYRGPVKGACAASPRCARRHTRPPPR
eukprot:1561451-Prymnesium_polylepis.1